MNKSPNRNSFQKEKYLARRAKEGKTPENDEEVRAMTEFYDDLTIKKKSQEEDLEWRKNNLEYDLRSTKWICDKAKSHEWYAQNIYAALCNNGFIKLDVIPILKNEEWSCSWRYAGGIVADMREEGDYIDWYCSGIRDIGVYAPSEENETLTDEQLLRKKIYDKFVPEGKITSEIKEDFQKLGWAIAPGGDWERFE